MLFLICPIATLKPTHSQFKPARGLKCCFSWTWTLQHWISGSIQPKAFRNFRTETVLAQPVWTHSGGAKPSGSSAQPRVTASGIWGPYGVCTCPSEQPARPPDAFPDFPPWKAPERGAAYGAKLCLFIYLCNKNCDLEPSCVFMISSHY